MPQTRAAEQYKAVVQHKAVKQYKLHGEETTTDDDDYLSEDKSFDPNSEPPKSPKRKTLQVRPPVGERLDSSVSSNNSYIKSSYGQKPNLYFPLILSVLMIVIAVFVIKKFTDENHTQIQFKNKNCSTLQNLADKFPVQRNFFWRTLLIETENVLLGKPPQPTVIVFVYEENSKTANNIVSQISTTMHTCFEAQGGALILSAKDFNQNSMIEDYGVAITTFKEKFKKSIVMFVHEIEKVHPNVVQAFHSFCDKVTPLVDKSIVLFTMKIEEASTKTTGELYELVEAKLSNLWKNFVPANKIQPLLARMTESVLYLETQG